MAISSEAFVAAQLARFGFDISIQYGANQPEYDLIVIKDNKFIKISVKGSQDGAWGLTQGYLKEANYINAIDLWENDHQKDIVFCFVQFESVASDVLPRMYIAKIDQVANHLRSCVKGRGDTQLRVRHVWAKGSHGEGTIDCIPVEWLLNEKAVQDIL